MHGVSTEAQDEEAGYEGIQCREAKRTVRQVTGVRVLFTGQYWPGANSMYIARAFERCGAIVRWLNDTTLFPGWTTTYGRITRRLLRPLIEREWNRQLLALVASFKPDLVYITNADLCWTQTIDAIRQRSIPVMCFYHDVKWKNRPGSRFSENIASFDLVATTRRWHEPEFKAAGAQAVAICRFGYDPAVHHPVVLKPEAQQTYASEMTFIGTFEPHRSADIEELVRQDFAQDFRLWGGYWNLLPPDSPVLKFWQQREVHEQEIALIYAASQIALHWVGWEPHGTDRELKQGDQHNSRTFQIAACGGAIMVAQRTDEHRRFFEEDVEAVFFDDVPELRDKLAYWLHPAQAAARQNMAVAARQRCQQEDYTYVPVVRTFLDHFGYTYTA